MYEISRRSLVMTAAGAAATFGLMRPIEFISTAHAQKAPDQLKPVFAMRLSQLGRSFMEKGEVERGAKLVRWAAVEAQRSGRRQEAARIWTNLLTRLSQEKDRGVLLRQYCEMPPPGSTTKTPAGVCAQGEPAGARETVAELSSQVAVLHARAAALTSQGKPAEAKVLLQQRLELLNRLAELEPRNQR